MKHKEHNFRAFTLQLTAQLAGGTFCFSTDRTDDFLLLYDYIEDKASVHELSPVGK